MFNTHQAHGYSRPSFKRAMLDQAASGVSNPSPTSIARILDGSCFEPVPLPFKVKRMPNSDSGFKLTRRHTLEDTTQNRGGGSRGSSDGDGSKSFSSYQRSKSQEVVVFKREIQNTSTKDHSDTKIRSPKKSTTSIQPKTSKKVSAKQAGRVNNVQAKQSLCRYDKFWTSEGCCLYHPTIRLAVKTGGVWDLLTDECPKCKLDF